MANCSHVEAKIVSPGGTSEKFVCYRTSTGSTMFAVKARVKHDDPSHVHLMLVRVDYNKPSATGGPVTDEAHYVLVEVTPPTGTPPGTCTVPAANDRFYSNKQTAQVKAFVMDAGGAELPALTQEQDPGLTGWCAP